MLVTIPLGPVPDEDWSWETMRRTMMKSKIHCATVTDANLNYVGSITIDTA